MKGGKGVSLQYALYYDLRPRSKLKVNEQGRFFTKNNGQTVFPARSKLCEYVVHENIAKINGTRSTVKTKIR